MLGSYPHEQGRYSSYQIRSLFTQPKFTLSPTFGHKFVTGYDSNKNVKEE